MFESSPDCVKILDLDGNLLSMNRNGMQAMEIDDFAAIAGKPWVGLWPEENLPQIMTAVAAAIEGGNGGFDAFCPTTQGKPRWWNVVITPVVNQQGAVERLLCVSRDVSAVHLSRQAISDSEERYRLLLTASSDIVWNARRLGEFDSEQPGWTAFTGQEWPELEGWGWLNAVHPDDRASVRANIDATLAALESTPAAQSSGPAAPPQPYTSQYRLRHADGSYRFVSTRAVPVPGPGGAIREWIGALSDQTEQRRAEERLRVALKGGRMGTWDLELGTGTLSCSEVCKANYGRRADESFSFEDLTACILEEDLPRFRQTVHRAIATASDFDMDYRVRWRNGEIHWIHVRGGCATDAAGVAIALSGVSIDTSERKQAEAALQNTSSRLNATLAAAEVATWTWDIRTDLVSADRNLARLFLGEHAESRELPIAAFFEAIHADDLIEVMAQIRKAIASGEPYEARYRVRAAGGGYRFVIARGRAEYAADGSPLRLPGVIVDVTRQHEAEEQLRASEERYHTLFDVMDEAFCVIEMMYDENGTVSDYRFIEANPAFATHTGMHGAVGRTMREMVPDHDEHWFATYDRVAKTGEALRFEDEAKALDRWFDVYAIRLGGPGSLRLALLFTDISERKRAEERLRQLADDLSEMDRRKTEFLATLAHELRNPLAPIRNGLEIMRLASSKPGTVARVRAVMERQVDQMVHLVDDLLDVARITRGQIDLKRQPVDLQTVIASAVETSMPLIEASGHHLEVSLDGQPLPLDADPTRLAQVLGNLLNNAAKYTLPGGRITLSVKREDAQAVVEVSDNGIGIPAEALDSIFEMFTQVGPNMDRASGGLGIGLSLVRRLVELHGGAVSATSAGPGRGSTFTLRLPLASKPAAEREKEAPPAAAESARSLRVLVVDDNVDAAETLAALVEMMGHQVHVAHDGAQALQLAAAFDPDVAFLDIGLPGMDGYDLARALRHALTAREGSAPPIALVALTGWGAEQDRAASAAAGFNHHLTKPADLGAIERLLAALSAPSSEVAASSTGSGIREGTVV
jgi:PAS domain S-box-containing protein